MSLGDTAIDEGRAESDLMHLICLLRQRAQLSRLSHLTFEAAQAWHAWEALEDLERQRRFLVRRGLEAPSNTGRDILAST
jgi:hypothetical protein